MTSRYNIPLAALLLLSACGTQDAEDTASNAGSAAGTEANATASRFKDFFASKPKPAPKAAENRYCYKTYEDIICYAKPLPGEEERLVGYQTAAGKTGYVLPPSQTKLKLKAHDAGSDATPSSADIQPLPVPGGSPGDQGSNKQLKEIIFDPSELEPKELVPDKPQ